MRGIVGELMDQVLYFRSEYELLIRRYSSDVGEETFEELDILAAGVLRLVHLPSPRAPSQLLPDEPIDPLSVHAEQFLTQFSARRLVWSLPSQPLSQLVAAGNWGCSIL